MDGTGVVAARMRLHQRSRVGADRRRVRSASCGRRQPRPERTERVPRPPWARIDFGLGSGKQHTPARAGGHRGTPSLRSPGRVRVAEADAVHSTSGAALAPFGTNVWNGATGLLVERFDQSTRSRREPSTCRGAVTGKIDAGSPLPGQPPRTGGNGDERLSRFRRSRCSSSVASSAGALKLMTPNTMTLAVPAGARDLGRTPKAV